MIKARKTPPTPKPQASSPAATGAESVTSENSSPSEPAGNRPPANTALTHDSTCTDCGTLFACANPHEPEMHQRRRDRGWDDRCQPCNQRDLEAWNRHLGRSPELYDSILKSKEEKSDET